MSNAQESSPCFSPGDSPCFSHRDFKKMIIARDLNLESYTFAEAEAMVMEHGGYDNFAKGADGISLYDFLMSEFEHTA